MARKDESQAMIGDDSQADPRLLDALASLNEISSAVNRISPRDIGSVEATLRLIVESAIEVVPGTSAVIYTYDRDTRSLPDRLARLTTPPGEMIPALLSRRHEITTVSSDLPCPPVALTQDLSSGLMGRPKHILDLYLARGVSTSTTPGSDMIPREFFRGLRMNLNRPVGNGRDDDW